MKPIWYVLWVITLVNLAGNSAASILDELDFSLSGYGTIGMTKASLGSEDLRVPLLSSDTANLGLPNPIVTSPEVKIRTRNTNYGISKRLDFSNNTIFGVQPAVNFSDNLSLISQLVTVANQEIGLDKFKVRIDWLYLKYDISDSTYVHLGQFRLPTLLNAESRRVGHLSVWADEPAIYRKMLPIGFANLAGVKIVRRHYVLDKLLSIALYGASNTTTYATAYSNSSVKQSGAYGGNLSLSGDWWTLQASAYGAMFKENLQIYNLQMAKIIRNGPTPEARQKAQEFNDLLNYGRESRAQFFSLSMLIEKSNWVFLSECARQRAKKTLTNYIGWYSTLGYRIGDFLPSLTIGHFRSLKAEARKAAEMIAFMQDPANGGPVLGTAPVEYGGNLAVADILKKFNTKYREYAFDLKYYINQSWSINGQAKLIKPAKNYFNEALVSNNKKFNTYSLNLNLVF